MRILIADDHPVVRRGLRQLLEENQDMAVAGEAATGDDVLALLRRDDFDIVILDLTMPGRNGLDVLKDIRQERPSLPVLILSMHPEEHFAIRVLRAGAAGYLTKSAAPEELVGAIRKVKNGGKYVSPKLAEQLAVVLEREAEGLPHERLTDREYQIMQLLASGKRVSEVADALALSVKTVSTHRARILEKMGLRNNAELTHYAIRNQLVD
ncbi:MAG: response regulator transcription factor [Acidobacteria bacterium]|nr:response regulator transcription factor [Acidobacteriota bacterium]